MKIQKSLAVALLALMSTSVYANSISIFDDTFTFLSGATPVANGTYDARWGTYSGGVFTQFLAAADNTANSGYIAVDPFGNEIQVSFAQTNNSAVAPSTQLALAFTPTLDR